MKPLSTAIKRSPWSVPKNLIFECEQFRLSIDESERRTFPSSSHFYSFRVTNISYLLCECRMFTSVSEEVGVIIFSQVFLHMWESVCLCVCICTIYSIFWAHPSTRGIGKAVKLFIWTWPYWGLVKQAQVWQLLNTAHYSLLPSPGPLICGAWQLDHLATH